MGWIPTSSNRGAHLKTSLAQGSTRRYSCYRSSRDHIGTQATRDAGDVFFLSKANSMDSRCGGRLEAEEEGN